MKLLHKLLCSLACIFLAALLTEAGPQGRIVYGYTAAPGKFPHQVSIQRDEGSVWCGGSVISESWVLTAAHCVYGISPLYLKFGTTNISAPLETRIVSGAYVIVHPNYDAGTLQNDLAVINIPAVPLSSRIWPIGLPGLRYNASYEGIVGTVSGWGQDETGQLDAEHLKYAHQRVISNAMCAEYYGSVAITENKLCASTLERMSICGGDSGGALYEESTGVQIGIASFVSNIACNAGAPAGFVRVTTYTKWIKDNTGIGS